MDMQNVSNLQISEGAVRTIHDKDNRLIWGRLAYDTKYVGNSEQRNLPKGYTQVLGIRAGNAASYFDIATTIGTDDSFEYSYSVSLANSSTHWGYRGATNYDSANSFSSTYGSGGRLVVFANSSSVNTSTRTTEPLAIDTRLDFKYDGDTKTASIPGYTFSKSSGFAPDFDPPQNHFVLNGIYIASTNNYVSSSANNIIYRFKSAECDIYPCVRDSDGTVGLYDVKRNIFIPPTAGTFTVVTGDVVPTPDTPIPVQTVTGEQTVKVSGKNLANVVIKPGVHEGVRASYDAQDGMITLSGTATTSYSIPFEYTFTDMPAGQYTIKQFGTLSNGRLGINFRRADNTQISEYVVNSSTLTRTFTLSEQPAKFYLFTTGHSSGQSITGNVQFQIESGSTATAYEPYQSQSYQIGLHGKNMFDKAEALTYKWLTAGTGQLVSSNDPNVVTPYIKVEIGKTYTFSGIGNLQIRVFGYVDMVSDKSTIYIDNVRDKRTFTAQYPYMRASIGGGDAVSVLNDIQLEQGGTATSFEAYHQIELCKIGDYQDYIYKSGDDWYVRKAINKVILNGSEAWSMYSGRNGTFYIAKSDIILEPSISATPNVISDYYEPEPFISLYNMIVDYGVANHNAQHWIAIRNKDYSDASSFKTWLASNNTTVYYALATPTDTKITDATLVGQLNDVHGWLTRYGYESTVSGDLPIVLQRDSLQ